MGEVLRKRLKAGHFESEIEESLLNILVTAGHLKEQIERICSESEITAAQYNLLRILRGGPPEGYSRREILERMIERAPDCTRLIDRLEQQKLVRRTRTNSDRRLSLASITREGSQLLDRIAPRIQSLHSAMSKRISVRDQRELSRILETLYESD